MRSANLALKFLLELGALAAYAAVCVRAVGGVAGGVLAVVAVLVVALVWGRWAAPRSQHRLPVRTRIPLELVVLLGAGVALLFVAPVLGAVLVVVVVVNAALLTAFGQWEA